MTNLIFSEHEMLLQKVSLLTNQINTLQKINIAYEEQDSLRIEEIVFYRNSYDIKSIEYAKLEKEHAKCRRWSVITGIAMFCLGVFVCR